MARFLILDTDTGRAASRVQDSMFKLQGPLTKINKLEQRQRYVIINNQDSRWANATEGLK